MQADNAAGRYRFYVRRGSSLTRRPWEVVDRRDGSVKGFNDRAVARMYVKAMNNPEVTS